MAEFVATLGIFLAAHALPARIGLRDRLMARFGRRSYLIGYSLLSLALLAWLIVAAQRADTVLLWEPSAWQRWVPLLLMPFALLFLMGGLMQPNPLSISIGESPAPGAIVSITRHPVLWGFGLWALSHIPPNGDAVSVILFGGMALFAFLGMPILDRRARQRLGEERWQAMSRGAPILPFQAIATGRAAAPPLRSLLAPAVMAALLYGWFLLEGHALLIGPDPLAGLA